MKRNDWLHKVAEFLGVSPYTIDELPDEIYFSLQDAMEEDDLMKVHHLGYEIRRYE